MKRKNPEVRYFRKDARSMGIWFDECGLREDTPRSPGENLSEEDLKNLITQGEKAFKILIKKVFTTQEIRHFRQIQERYRRLIKFRGAVISFSYGRSKRYEQRSKRWLGKVKKEFHRIESASKAWEAQMRKKMKEIDLGMYMVWQKGVIAGFFLSTMPLVKAMAEILNQPDKTIYYRRHSY